MSQELNSGDLNPGDQDSWDDAHRGEDLPTAETPHDDIPFGPPAVPIEVECMHCGGVFMSSELVLRDWPGIGVAWTCPLRSPNGRDCDGVGFLFDIWPTDQDWRDEGGNKVWFEDDTEEPDGNSGDEDYRLAGEWTPQGDPDFTPIDDWRPNNETRDDQDLPF